MMSSLVAFAILDLVMNCARAASAAMAPDKVATFSRPVRHPAHTAIAHAEIEISHGIKTRLKPMRHLSKRQRQQQRHQRW